MGQVRRNWMNIFDKNPPTSFIIFILLLLFISACTNQRLAKQAVNEEVRPEEPEFIPPCLNPLTEFTFATAVDFLKSESQPLHRMNLAKQLVESTCLNVYQLIRISQVFDKEQEVIDFAIYAYPFCYNPRSYFLFEKELSLESNKQKLKDLLKE